MVRLRKNPHIYEINLMPWMRRIAEKEHRPVTLDTISSETWMEIESKGMDGIWLMGMWHRSKDACQKARQEPRLIEECGELLPDFTMEDLAGSPYAVDDYSPDPTLGGKQDLLRLKERMADMHLALILDFVPNHTACDHPWVKDHPDFYVRTSMGEDPCPNGFFAVVDEKKGLRTAVAHGRDPFFAPWNDTAQLDYSHAQTVESMAKTLSSLPRYCHGLRCDMAMLVLKKVFNETWKDYLADPMDREFWKEALEGLKTEVDSSLLIGEVYWGLEKDFLDLGFDYVYDKTFYDLLVACNVEDLRAHLLSPVDKQEKMVRFLENHDEPRALTVFGQDRIYSAMVIHATVPGMRLWHQGQFEGNQFRVPVQLGRAPDEPVQQRLSDFSSRLLHEANQEVFHEGKWALCTVQGCSNNPTYRNLLAWCWRQEDERRLIVVNLSPDVSVGMVNMPEKWLPRREPLVFFDPLKDDQYIRSTMQVGESGLYVELKAGDFHFFTVQEG